jgi:hypothetical protein
MPIKRFAHRGNRDRLLATFASSFGPPARTRAFCSPVDVKVLKARLISFEIVLKGRYA